MKSTWKIRPLRRINFGFAPREKQTLFTMLYSQKQTCSDESQSGVVLWRVLRACWKNKSQHRCRQQRGAWMIINVRLKTPTALGDCAPMCARIALRCLYLARIGRPDLLWTGQHAGTISHQLDHSMWQKFGTSDKLHQSSETLQYCSCW